MIITHPSGSLLHADSQAETTNFLSEVCEMALAHAVANKTEAAYWRRDLFEKRRALMEAWSGFLTEPKASNVVQLKAVAK